MMTQLNDRWIIPKYIYKYIHAYLSMRYLSFNKISFVNNSILVENQ